MGASRWKLVEPEILAKLEQVATLPPAKQVADVPLTKAGPSKKK